MKLTVLQISFIIVHLKIYTLVFGTEKLDSECHKDIRSEDGKSYLRKYYCCNNHVRHNGICVECNVGYISQSEDECLPCPLNSYGKRCAFTCTSCPEERCHHITGCLRNNTDHYRTTFSDSIAGRTQSTPINELTTPEQVFANKHIVVYAACIAGLLLVVTFCYAIIHNLRSKSRQMQQNYDMQNHEQQRQLVPQINNESSINVHIKDNIYDEIDELNITEEFPIAEQKQKDNLEITISVSDIREGESSSDSNESRSSGTSETKSYLNPYQLIVPDLDLHNYTQPDGDLNPVISKQIVL